MSVNIITCIAKRHGTCFFSRKALHITFRQYAANKLQKKKAKVVAAASAACVAERVHDDDTPNVKKVIPSIIGEKNNTTSVKSPITRDAKLPSSRHKVNPHAYIEDFSHIGLPKSKNSDTQQEKSFIPMTNNFKPVCEIINSTSKQKSSEKPLKLLNALNPTYGQWHRQLMQPHLLLKHYMALSKIRLTGLVVITTAAGYGMAYAPFEPITFLYTLVGTALMSASANSINQLLEVPYDSQMTRTKNRVLIRGYLTPLHAAAFAACTSALGISVLYLGVNTITAGLGIINLLLYTSVYTPLKRCSIVNTWVGSIVGAIPPLMGWAACTGSLNASALLMGAILFSWQFPHFNALSWNLRPDYSRAGYRMMSVINPDLCRKTALRHSFAILFFCSIAPLVDLTTWSFPIDSFPLNCYFIYCSWKFYKSADSQTSRKLFRLSLVHLPGLMLLMFIGKRYALPESSVELMNL